MRINPINNRWSPAELQKITEADDLKISLFRDDGVTYGTPTWIWNVTVNGELYVRAYYGQKSRWYQAALQQKEGRIQAAGMIKDVLFAQIEGSVNDRIDEAYRIKYKSSPYLHDQRAGQIGYNPDRFII